MVKHRFMLLIWRIQQSQALIAPLFYAATLAGVFWPVVQPYFITHGFPPSQVGLGLLLLFAFTFFFISLLGLVYDRVLKLWKEQVEVGMERNPYTRERLQPKEILLWRKLHIRTLQQVAEQEPEASADIEFMERWIARSMADPRIRAQVEEMERWIEGPGITSRSATGEPLFPAKSASKGPP